MDLEELKERYKMLPIWARLLAASVIGILPAVYIYFDEGESLQGQLTEAQSQEDAARTKFEQSRKKKANLPKLEEQLAFTEEQLLKAKKKLPDSYRIEDVLQKSATIAKQTGAKLTLFDPGSERKQREPYQYVEMPIRTEIEGRFSQIAAFFDRVIHLDGSVFLRKVELTRVDAENRDRDGDRAGPTFQAAKDARDNMRVKGSFDLVVYRGMTEAELAEGDGGEAGDGVPGGVPKPKADGAGDAPPAPPPGGDAPPKEG